MKIYSFNLIPGLIVRRSGADGGPVDVVITTVHRDADEELVHATGQVANDTTLWSNKFDFGDKVTIVGISPHAASGDEIAMTNDAGLVEVLAENVDYGTED